MKKLIKYIIPLISLVIIAVCITLAWFVSTPKATGGIVVTTGEVAFDYKLYQLEEDSWVLKDDRVNGVNKTTYESCEFNNLNPGDVVYFLLKINTSSNMKLTLSYGDYESSLNDNIKYDSSNVYVVDNDSNKLNLYDIKDNKVVVEDKTLYSINNNKISLDQYKLENVINSYTILNEVNNSFDINTYTPSINDKEAHTLKDDILSSYSIVPNQDNYIVFALEFNEVLSLVDGNSNCYRYQTLNIKSINMNVVLGGE